MTGRDLTGAAMRAAIGALQARAASDGSAGAIHAPVTAIPVAHGRGLIIDVPLAGNGGDAVSNRVLLILRS